MMKILNAIEVTLITMLEIIVGSMALFVITKYIWYYQIGELLRITSNDMFDIITFVIWATAEILTIILWAKLNVKLYKRMER